MNPYTNPFCRLTALGLLLLALAAGPAARAQILGSPETNDFFGDVLAAGDFDDDAYVDLAVGVPGEDLVSLSGSIPNAGTVNVVYGAPGGLNDTGNQSWTQNSTGISDTAEDNDDFGAALATGDFDGDGYDDLAIGAPGESRNGNADVGQVHVLYGSASGLTSAGSFYFPQLTFAHTGKRFGAALAAGDFNEDGRDDLAVGIPGQDIGSATGAGALAVFFGSASGVVVNGYQVWHQNVTGIAGFADTGDQFGFALAAGDFNNDAEDDLAIGVPFEDDDGVTNSGAAHVLYGTPGAGLSATGSELWYQGSAGIEGSVGSDRFGYALAAGDFDEDGYDDLAAGSPYESVGSLASAGAVNVIYGSVSGLTSTGDQIWTQDIAGGGGISDTGDYFGLALAAGDFDLDGAFDLAIGVPYEDLGSTTNNGAVNVMYGVTGIGLSAAGGQLWWQGSTGIPGAEENTDLFGSALAAGDFGTSFADALAIGVPYEDAGGATNAGAVNTIYGASGTGLNTTSQTPQIFYQGVALRLVAPVAGEKGEEVIAEAASVLAAEAPVALALLPAAPNPSAGQTTLRFTLPAPGAVRLAVYDVLGREVAVLEDGALEAGAHSTTFDGSALPAGAYLVRLTAGTQVLTERLTLVR